MLTEILDHWEILKELRQQQATWQQRWDQAYRHYQGSLEQLEPADRQRLDAVLTEMLTEYWPPATAPPTPPSPTPPAAPTPPVAPTALAADPVGHVPRTSAADFGAAEAPTAGPTPAPTPAPTPTPGPATSPADSPEALLQWATDTIGDGVTENELFQALRKSPFAAKASDLFKILEKLDAFYDTDDGDIRVRSLRTTTASTNA